MRYLLLVLFVLSASCSGGGGKAQIAVSNQLDTTPDAPDGRIIGISSRTYYDGSSYNWVIKISNTYDTPKRLFFYPDVLNGCDDSPLIYAGRWIDLDSSTNTILAYSIPRSYLYDLYCSHISVSVEIGGVLLEDYLGRSSPQIISANN